MAIKKTTKSKAPSGIRYSDTQAAQAGMSREQIASQAQSLTAPQPTPKPTRYTTPISPGQTPLPKASSVLSKPTLGTVNEKKIREETRKRMQSSIDAINANYTNLISQERVQGEDRTGQTRAMNARGGLIGSDFGYANQEKTTSYNKQQQQYLVDQQNAQVTSVMQNIEDRASVEIQNKKQEALGKYQMDLNEFNTAKESARADLKILAESGTDLNSLNPAQKAALLKQSGYDGQFGELIYNAMKPKPKQIDYKFEKLADGKGMFYGVDPQTGELKRIDVSVDLPPDWQMQIAPDGTIIGYDKNTGEARVLSEQGQFAKRDSELDEQLKRAQIAKIEAEIANTGDRPLTPQEAANYGLEQGTMLSEIKGMILKKPLSGEALKLQSNAKSGLNSLSIIKRELFGDPNKDLNQPGDIRSNILFRAGIGMAREYASAQREIMDILVRLRTGAAISENEEKYYRSQLPGLLDNEPTVRSKLQRFEDLFNNIVPERVQGMSDSAQDLFQQFEGGSEGADFFKVKGTRQSVEPMKPVGNTPYLKTLGVITGIDGSKYWKWGLDVDLKKGDKVKSPANGQIIAIKKASETGGFGNQVRIKTNDGKELWLSHLDALPKTKPGTKIRAGQVLALGGNSGNTYSTSNGDGSHLDITMPKPGGGYYTAREVKAYLDNKYV